MATLNAGVLVVEATKERIGFRVDNAGGLPGSRGGSANRFRPGSRNLAVGELTRVASGSAARSVAAVGNRSRNPLHLGSTAGSRVGNRFLLLLHHHLRRIGVGVSISTFRSIVLFLRVGHMCSLSFTFYQLYVSLSLSITLVISNRNSYTQNTKTS